jgi:hypothetical protein
VAEPAIPHFRLELGAAPETVTVEGNGPNINASDASVSTVISREIRGPNPSQSALPGKGRQ